MARSDRDISPRGHTVLLVYNLTGFLVGAAGLAAGVIVMNASGRAAAGLLTMASVWIILGGRRPLDPVTGQRRAAPSLFLIPLRWLGVPLAVLAIGFAFVEKPGNRRGAARDGSDPAVATTPSRDPRARQLDADHRALDAKREAGDDAALAAAVRAFLVDASVQEAQADQFHVLANTRDSGADGRAALVLVQADNLRKFSDEARKQLIDSVATAVARDRPDVRKLYVGVRGRAVYGAVRTPLGGTRTGRYVSQSALHDYYGPPPADPRTSTTAPATAPAAPATIPAAF